ncbi:MULTISPECIES: SycD/LcrH family type III secretion system chaperone VcrH [Vibrio]|jgi:type III secretion system low calcium response chaperone LcrH/SycD|uniref:CesD/SycD/LcrH family type III secretion system chaperone n=1 Tax=Vibrio diabolicus TaxID=50719 RepID=A0AA92R7Y7_9VIBR|nr:MULTISPECIES: SycD/LcrH family type III secretion system chaperone VcrH [Vibrio]MCR9494731.1 SycD/LcrH family type III secretion system chaperone VcrH [Vibrio alginolyticus]AVF60241.1 CesD/SycD/LcrH family type III secretion system chaperone [Vibrio diabolicus]EMD78934.1 type III secretion chaperone protein for YopD (SycD) [Vibrio diabolicus E0666]MCF7479431.1 SycD/LcrH family type III secretion system chaperone VcrH [Vibrio sp. J2-4]MCG6222403.1 SycD/LcrH family type III secretion system c
MTKQNATDPSQMQAEELLSFLEEGGTLKMLHDVSQDTIEHIYAVGYNFFQSGKIEQAAKVFQLLSMLDHYQARFFIGLGAARQELGEYLQAIDAYSYAALVDVNDPRPPFHSAECHLKLEQLTEAESGFYSAKEMSAGKSQYADLHERAGIMLEAVRNKKE